MSRFKRRSPKGTPTTPAKTPPVVIKNNGNGKNGKRVRLTPNERIFTDEWLIDRNGTRAYMVAYPNIKNKGTAGVLAHKKLKKAKIAAYIEKRLKKLSATARIDTEWVLKRYEMLADYCIDDFFNDDGTMKPFSEIPKESLYAIGGFKQSKRTLTTKDKVHITNVIKEFKLSKKKEVLDSIGRYLGMDKKDDHPKTPIVPIQIVVNLVDN